MTAADARRLLDRLDRNYRAWRTRKDCRFVFGPLKAALSRLDRPGAPAADRRLLAVAYSFLGDVLDFIDAPREAARAYRAAARVDPADEYAWSELGHMLLKCGRFRAAARALDRGMRAGDDYSYLPLLREEAQEGIDDPAGTAPYRSWLPAESRAACELLARNRPEAVLKALRGKRHPYLRQLRARAHGALGDAAAFIGEWEGLRGTRGGIEIELADWFFGPPGLWDMPRFWRALDAIRHRSVPGFGPIHDALWEIVPEPKRWRWRSKAALRRHRRRHTLAIRYHLARTERDAAKARRLARRYPGWPQAVELARKLGT